MATSEENLFKSTGTITLDELTARYPDMTSGDIILKFAEHKNFDGARAEFQKWDEHHIIEADNLISQNYRHIEKSSWTREKLMAMSFLKELIKEWDNSRSTKTQTLTRDPMLIIGSVPFTINTSERNLKQLNNPRNIISFDDLKDEGEYFKFEFDTRYNKIYAEWREFEKQEDRIIDVFIPAQILDKPEELSESFIQDLNLMSQKKGCNIFISDQQTALRLAGVLPHIDLAGTDFTIDWRLKELRETAEPWKNISFRDLEMDESGEQYLCFFNTQTHEIYIPNEDIRELPENVVVLEIPYEIKLDPVAVAREYGMPETELLLTHPIQDNLSAKVTPLSESGLPEFIANNIRNTKNYGQGSDDQNDQTPRQRR